MRIFAACLITCFVFAAHAQKSEALVPKQALSVVSLNNVTLLQRISLDDLVKYEFMEELQQELFDGSTSGKTLRDSGIDFDQKLNVFVGMGDHYEIGGVTFGVKDRDQLFEVFDDFQPAESSYEGVEFYTSYFNTLAIRGNSAILIRVSPSDHYVTDLADSIWMARGNSWEWTLDYELEDLIRELENTSEEGIDENEILNELEEYPELYESEEKDIFEQTESEDDPSIPVEDLELPVADEDPTTKTYYELIDSLQAALQQEYMIEVCEDLFVKDENLLKSSERFRQQLTHSSEGVFYLDNSHALRGNPEFINWMRFHPTFRSDLEALYNENVILGDMLIRDNAIELQLEANYGEDLGTIYEGMTDARFSKQICNYIHKDHAAFFTFRLNTREAYERAFEVIHPILEHEAEQSRSFAEQLFALEMWDELINKDAVFNACKGGGFGTYSGIAKVKTKKYIFDYDEVTFEYSEREVEAEEDMPLFTFGITTEYPTIAEKILRHLDRIESRCYKENDVWVFDKAILNAAPLYVFIRNGLILFTNDENLAKQNPDGYGADGLEKTLVKRAKKSGFVYGYADMGKAIQGLPRQLFGDNENELVDVIRGKSGHVEFTSTATSSSKTGFNLLYEYEGEYDASGTYLLDLINSLYVISK